MSVAQPTPSLPLLVIRLTEKTSVEGGDICEGGKASTTQVYKYVTQVFACRDKSVSIQWGIPRDTMTIDSCPSLSLSKIFPTIYIIWTIWFNKATAWKTGISTVDNCNLQSSTTHVISPSVIGHLCFIRLQNSTVADLEKRLQWKVIDFIFLNSTTTVINSIACLSLPCAGRHCLIESNVTLPMLRIGTERQRRTDRDEREKRRDVVFCVYSYWPRLKYRVSCIFRRSVS